MLYRRKLNLKATFETGSSYLSFKSDVPGAFNSGIIDRPISVYRLGEMPIQSCGQSVSAPRGKAGARLNAHTELRAKRQRSARKAIYRNRPIEPAPPYHVCQHRLQQLYVNRREKVRPRAVAAQVEIERKV